MASRILITIRDEISVDSQADARVERVLEKAIKYMINNLGYLPHTSSRCG